MKTAVVVLLVLLFVLRQQATPQKPAPEKPDLSTPEATVRAFVAAINDLNLVRAAVCVVDANNMKDALEKAQTELHNLERGRPKTRSMLTITSLQTESQGDTATVILKYTPQAVTGQLNASEDRITLRRVGTNWQVVPPDVQQIQPGTKIGMVSAFAAILTNPMALQATVISAKVRVKYNQNAISCLSNVKQLCLAVMMFLQDHDEKFTFKATTYKKSLKSYVKKEAVFHCPEDSGRDSYSFNRSLQGVSLAQINAPAATVLFYEGKNQRLNFRHEGKAVVGFVDGHVKLINAQGAKSLRWKP